VGRGKRSAVSSQQSAVSNQQSAVSNQQSAISNQQKTCANSFLRHEWRGSVKGFFDSAIAFAKADAFAALRTAA